jgi:hypothetical protein
MKSKVDKWRNNSSVICDKKYLSNLKENFIVQLLDLHIYMELNVR